MKQGLAPTSRYAAQLLNQCVRLLHAAARLAQRAHERGVARRVRRALKVARGAHRKRAARPTTRSPYSRSRRRPNDPQG